MTWNIKIHPYPGIFILKQLIGSPLAVPYFPKLAMSMTVKCKQDTIKK
jgi:hypothetical protein